MWLCHLEVGIDSRGRIVIPKAVRERYGLSVECRLELVAREGVIELFPLAQKAGVAMRYLAEPCQTGDKETRHRSFDRERAWTR